MDNIGITQEILIQAPVLFAGTLGLAVAFRRIAGYQKRLLKGLLPQ